MNLKKSLEHKILLEMFLSKEVIPKFDALMSLPMENDIYHDDIFELFLIFNQAPYTRVKINEAVASNAVSTLAVVINNILGEKSEKDNNPSLYKKFLNIFAGNVSHYANDSRFVNILKINNEIKEQGYSYVDLNYEATNFMLMNLVTSACLILFNIDIKDDDGSIEFVNDYIVNYINLNYDLGELRIIYKQSKYLRYV